MCRIPMISIGPKTTNDYAWDYCCSSLMRALFVSVEGQILDLIKQYHYQQDNITKLRQGWKTEKKETTKRKTGDIEEGTKRNDPPVKWGERNRRKEERMKGTDEGDFPEGFKIKIKHARGRKWVFARNGVLCGGWWYVRHTTTEVVDDEGWLFGRKEYGGERRKV